MTFWLFHSLLGNRLPIIDALIKKINNVKPLKPSVFETHDNYLGFESEDFEFVQRFSFRKMKMTQKAFKTSGSMDTSMV